MGVGGGVTVLQLANNSLVLMDRQEDRVRGVVGGRARANRAGRPGFRWTVTSC